MFDIVVSNAEYNEYELFREFNGQLTTSELHGAKLILPCGGERVTFLKPSILIQI